ncbi:MAG: 2Fe-2S iron-sulfur cluster-binding protein [Pseudomonadota bacterium]
MSNITFIDPDNNVHTIGYANQATVMSVAIQNGINGITAECGGACSCATCHVYVEQGFDSFPDANETETELLEFTAAQRKPHSRLGCQLKLSTEHASVVIRLPEAQ